MNKKADPITDEIIKQLMIIDLERGVDITNYKEVLKAAFDNPECIRLSGWLSWAEAKNYRLLLAAYRNFSPKTVEEKAVIKEAVETVKVAQKTKVEQPKPKAIAPFNPNRATYFVDKDKDEKKENKEDSEGDKTAREAYFSNPNFKSAPAPKSNTRRSPE